MPLIKARSSSIMDNVDLRGQPTAETALQTVNTNQLACYTRYGMNFKNKSNYT